MNTEDIHPHNDEAAQITARKNGTCNKNDSIEGNVKKDDAGETARTKETNAFQFVVYTFHGKDNNSTHHTSDKTHKERSQTQNACTHTRRINRSKMTKRPLSIVGERDVEFKSNPQEGETFSIQNALEQTPIDSTVQWYVYLNERESARERARTK
eukprot:Opistho-2@5610